MAEEGEVKDLREKLEKGEMTREEVLAEMKKRGLYHHTGEPIPGIFAYIGMLLWALLCFLPLICRLLNIDLSNIPSIDIPIKISYLAIFFVIILSPPLFYSAILRERTSETGDENIILVRVAGYKIVRHPATLGGVILIIGLPIIFSFILPFTILSIVGEIAVIIGAYLQAGHEEKINIRKWGNEYRQYMKEVPRFNFIKGLWNLRKRGR
jgi:protein-S-isoprenylcysteine O-methyltransferase Ste14